MAGRRGLAFDVHDSSDSHNPSADMRDVASGESHNPSSPLTLWAVALSSARHDEKLAGETIHWRLGGGRRTHSRAEGVSGTRHRRSQKETKNNTAGSTQLVNSRHKHLGDGRHTHNQTG